MWIKYNPNPVARMVDDCAVRAISKALDTDWEQAHILLDINAINMGDMPHANSVWGSVLRQMDSIEKRYQIPVRIVIQQPSSVKIIRQVSMYCLAMGT